MRSLPLRAKKATALRNARPNPQRRTAESWLLEALDDMRKAYALLKAAESKLLSQVKTPAGIRDSDRKPVRPRAAAGIPRLVVVEQKQTSRKQPKLNSVVSAN